MLLKVSEWLGESLGQAIERGGLELPVIQVVVSANGQVIVVRRAVLGGWSEAEQLCEHITENYFALPVNVYFSDNHGKSVLAVISDENAAPKWVN